MEKYCVTCGSKLDKDEKFCHQCGKNTKTNVKKKKMPVWCILLIIFVSLFFLGFLLSDDNDTESNVEKNPNQIGNYIVTIDKYKITKDYDNQPIILVTYSFTNKSDSNTSFDSQFEDKAYQNGIEITEPISTYGIKDLDWEDEIKEIEPNKTFTFNIAYQLKNTTDEVKIKVEPNFSFDDVAITKTFKIK